MSEPMAQAGWVEPPQGEPVIDRDKIMAYEAGLACVRLEVELAAARHRGDAYRARARVLVKRCWRYRVRWRMAEMEVRDLIKLHAAARERGDAAGADAARLAALLQEADSYAAHSPWCLGRPCNCGVGETRYRVAAALAARPRSTNPERGEC